MLHTKAPSIGSASIHCPCAFFTCRAQHGPGSWWCHSVMFTLTEPVYMPLPLFTCGISCKKR